MELDRARCIILKTVTFLTNTTVVTTILGFFKEMVAALSKKTVLLDMCLEYKYFFRIYKGF